MTRRCSPMQRHVSAVFFIIRAGRRILRGLHCLSCRRPACRFRLCGGSALGATPGTDIASAAASLIGCIGVEAPQPRPGLAGTTAQVTVRRWRALTRAGALVCQHRGPNKKLCSMRPTMAIWRSWRGFWRRIRRWSTVRIGCVGLAKWPRGCVVSHVQMRCVGFDCTQTEQPRPHTTNALCLAPPLAVVVVARPHERCPRAPVPLPISLRSPAGLRCTMRHSMAT